MEQLKERYSARIRGLDVDFIRYLENEVDWSYRLIALKGARGVGKTTLMLQKIKKSYGLDRAVLYASLDDIYFSSNSLLDLAGDFVKGGGKYLFLDEVHKYSTWSIEIKNIYDNYPDLHLVFTASSILELYKGQADLSRRLISYELHGLSFREYLIMNNGLSLPVLSLQEILENHVDIASELTRKFRPLAEFNDYIKYGYYPYFKENVGLYSQRLSGAVNAILEVDLPWSDKFEFTQLHKLKKLLYIIATSVPFKPNIARLSRNIEATRTTVLLYLNYLERAHLLNSLKSDISGLKIMVKPEKIYLNNTNLMYALAPGETNTGSLRETFFFNQMKVNHDVRYTRETDFLVDDKYYFEIGGKGKGSEQIKDMDRAFIVSDNIELGYGNRIPLWLFGLLY